MALRRFSTIDEIDPDRDQVDDRGDQTSHAAELNPFISTRRDGRDDDGGADREMHGSSEARQLPAGEFDRRPSRAVGR